MDNLNEYAVQIAGIEHTVQMTDDEATKRGYKPVKAAPKAKAAAKPANKAAAKPADKASGDDTDNA